MVCKTDRWRCEGTAHTDHFGLLSCLIVLLMILISSHQTTDPFPFHTTCEPSPNPSRYTVRAPSLSRYTLDSLGSYNICPISNGRQNDTV